MFAGKREVCLFCLVPSQKWSGRQVQVVVVCCPPGPVRPSSKRWGGAVHDIVGGGKGMAGRQV